MSRKITISRNVLWILLFVMASKVTNAQAPDPTVTKLFQNSYKVYDGMRLYGGIYLDALAINVPAKPAGLAANGVGLVSLCIADAMYKKTGDVVNWDANAESKALITINEWVRLKNTVGATNVNGLFHRYFKPSDGSVAWANVTEHSTIDNAILATGFLFCKNYFNSNSEIVEKTTALLNSMDFTAAIPASGNQMYMILDDNGVGSAMVKPFNEYMLLAWWAKNSNPSFAGYNRAQTYWTNNYIDANVLPKYSYPDGNPTLSEGTTSAQPSFHVQFCLYYCNYFGNNTEYLTYFGNQAKADKAWWQNTTSQQIAWGCGAGEIPGGGYSADAVNRNSDKIVSPHIMAGFSPVYPEVRDDLIALYDHGAGSSVYKIPGTDYEFLWRYKYSKPAQRASFVQAVDFSTMLYGLAALPEYLGIDFFKTYNDFKFDPSTFSNGPNNMDGHLDIYPNPFSGETAIQFVLEIKADVKIEIFGESGQLIKHLVNKEMIAGKHTINWDAKDQANRQVQSGIYFCRMVIGNHTFQTEKITFLRQY